MVCISYVNQIEGQAKVHLITASVAGCNIYYVIKDKMDRLKSYQRLNNTVYKDNVLSMQNTFEDKYSHIDVSNLINSFRTIQVEHLEISLADNDELFLIAAKGIRPVGLAQSGNKQGDDAKNISITYRGVLRGNDAVNHLIQYQSTDDNAIAISRLFSSSEHNIAPTLMGVFSGYNGSRSSEFLVQQLSDEIFSRSLKCITPQQQLQLIENRSKANEGIKENRLRNGRRTDTASKGLSDIFALINSRASKIIGFREISDYFRGKFIFDNAEAMWALRETFAALLGLVETILICQDVLDIHKHNILDKYLLFIDKSDSWRQLLKELRDLAFNWLTRIAEKCETNEQAVIFLEEYRNHKVFSVHRANHWFQKIGRTQTVIEIDKLIEIYKTRPRIVPI